MAKFTRRDILGYAAAGGIAAGISAWLQPPVQSQDQKTHHRVLQNQTLRCGYNTSPPWFSFDANKKAVGVYADIMQALGDALSIKIEWVEEISLADFPAALESGRIDVYAFPVAPTAGRARGADFLNTLVAVPFRIAARKVRHLHDDWRSLDSKAVTVSSLEGAMNDKLAREFFPQTRALTLPQTSAFSDIFLNVASGKADIVIQDVVSTRNFIRSNPGTLEVAEQLPPVVVLPWTVAIRKNEFALKQMLNTAIEDLRTMGKINAIHQKHGIYGDGVIPETPPHGTTIALQQA